MKPYLRLLCLGCLTGTSLAGWAQAPAKTPQISATIFFDADFQPASSSDSTAFCAETSFRDSTGGVTRVYYPSGHLKQYIPYANVFRRLLYGTVSTWYEDGQIRTKEDYVRGIRNGDLLTYYPDGALKRHEQYVNGRCGVGRCYAPDGTFLPYFSYEQLPLYPGGEEQLTKELARAVSLTSAELDAMRRESSRMRVAQPQSLRRQVDVELSVAADGRITNARVVQSTAGFLNNAALRAVTKLKRQFVPGRRDGQVMVSYLTVPVYYTLLLPYRPGYSGSRGHHAF